MCSGGKKEEPATPHSTALNKYTVNKSLRRSGIFQFLARGTKRVKKYHNAYAKNAPGPMLISRVSPARLWSCRPLRVILLFSVSPLLPFFRLPRSRGVRKRHPSRGVSTHGTFFFFGYSFAERRMTSELDPPDKSDSQSVRDASSSSSSPPHSKKHASLHPRIRRRWEREEKWRKVISVQYNDNAVGAVGLHCGSGGSVEGWWLGCVFTLRFQCNGLYRARQSSTEKRRNFFKKVLHFSFRSRLNWPIYQCDDVFMHSLINTRFHPLQK